MSHNILSKLKIYFSLAVFIFALQGCSEEEEFPPVVEIVSPLGSAIMDQTFAVEVSATADTGIEKVELYLNNTFVGRADTEPYNFTINVDGYNSGHYTIKAIAFSKSGKSSAKEISVTIAKPTIAKPLEFVASKGQFGNKIMLKWNDSPGATSYQVFKQNNSSKEYIMLATVNENSFEDLTIETPLTQYFYKVRAYNSSTVYGDFSEYDYGYSNGKPYDLIRSFGIEGTQLDQFGLVVHIGYKNDMLYLSDWYNQRIVKYTKEGTSPELVKAMSGNSSAPFFYQDMMIIGSGESQKISFLQDDNEIKCFATDLMGPGQITVDKNDFIYITDWNRVTKYNINGNVILRWGGAVKGDLPGQFNGSFGIAFYNNTIVVSNIFSNKVQFFSTTGEFIKEWVFDSACYDIFVDDNYIYIACGTYIAKTDFQGLVIEKIYGDFSSATGIAIDENKNIYVTDPYERKVYVYKKN